MTAQGTLLAKVDTKSAIVYFPSTQRIGMKWRKSISIQDYSHAKKNQECLGWKEESQEKGQKVVQCRRTFVGRMYAV